MKHESQICVIMVSVGLTNCFFGQTKWIWSKIKDKIILEILGLVSLQTPLFRLRFMLVCGNKLGAQLWHVIWSRQVLRKGNFGSVSYSYWCVWWLLRWDAVACFCAVDS